MVYVGLSERGVSGMVVLCCVFVVRTGVEREEQDAEKKRREEAVMFREGREGSLTEV